MYSLFSPQIFFRSNPFRIDYPSVTGIHDRRGNTGYGTTEGGYLGLKSSYGEFLERYIFRFHIPSISNKSSLRNIAYINHESFTQLFSQTCSEKLKSSIVMHEFELVEVVNVIKNVKVFLPRVLVTLGFSNDRGYFLVGDSTGCAGHVESQKCFENSLLEFIERQTTLSSWLGLNKVEQITFSALNEANLDPYLENIITSFSKKGTLLIYNLSKEFSVYTIIAIFTHNQGAVRFAVGLGSGFDAETALKKALMELMQIYDWTADIDYFKPKDQERIYSLNKESSLSKLKWINDPKYISNIIDIENFINLPSTNHLNALSQIASISDEIYYYTSSLKIGGQVFIGGKLFSPDFFLSSSNLNHNNWVNKFSLIRGFEVNQLPTEACPLF